jgi:hypothetical protein
MRQVLPTIVFALVCAGLSLPAIAAETEKQKPRRDPNEMICRTEPVLGSRLAKRRNCMTRAQWSERQASDRALVERTQMTPCMPTRGSNCY